MTDIQIVKSDLHITPDGDMTLGVSDLVHQQHLLMAAKGQYKAFPEVGIDLAQLLNSENVTEALIEAKKQLIYDGMSVNSVYINSNNRLIIDGDYQ